MVGSNIFFNNRHSLGVPIASTNGALGVTKNALEPGNCTTGGTTAGNAIPEVAARAGVVVVRVELQNIYPSFPSNFIPNKKIK